MAQFLDQEYWLHDQNREFYAHEKAHETLFFLNLFGTNQNETGSFTSISSEVSAAKELADKIMSQPSNYAEGIEFTDIDFADAEPVSGTLGGKGFGFKYSDFWKANGMMTSTYPVRVTKTISALCIYTDILIANALINSAAVANAPTLSKWSDDTAIDAKDDIINIQEAFSNDGFRYQATDILLANTEYFELCAYLNSFDIKYDVLKLNWNGINFWNLDNAMPSGQYIALNSKVPAVVLEKYTNPNYSTIQKARNDAKAAGNDAELKKLPDALVNYYSYKPEGQPEMNRDLFWFNMMPNVVEPHSVMVGEFTS